MSPVSRFDQFILFFLLLSQCFLDSINSTEDKPGPSSQPSKKRKSIKSMTIEEAKKAKDNAEKKQRFDYRNLNEAWESGITISHSGHDRWVDLLGKRKKAESNTRRHDLASRLLRENGVMRDVLHNRAQELRSVPYKIQERMDKVKSTSVPDKSLTNARIGHFYKKARKHRHMIAKYDKVIKGHYFSSSSSSASLSSQTSSSEISSTSSSNEPEEKRRGKRQRT